MAAPLLLTLLLGSSLTVIMAQEPRLEVQPGTISKGLGDTVYVSCTAKVTDPSLVTEMKWIGPLGEQIPSLDGTIETIEDGPGSLGLYIQKLKEQDTGIYNCSAVYAGNQNLHTFIDVKSFAPIDFGETPTRQTPNVGTDALIKCTVTSNPAPQVDWLKDGILLRTDDRHIIQQDGVLVRNVQESDEGVYRCRARVRQLGVLENRDIQVEVHVPPQITTPPEDTSGVEKEAVTFQCVALGKPAPKYSWVDDQSRPLDGQEGYYVDEVKGELTILDLRPDQAGTYRCTAENAAGNDFAEAKLRVLTKPKLEQFLNITVDVNANAEFRCVFSGDPKPEIIFQKETSLEPFDLGINSDDRIEVEQSVDEYGNSVGILKISEVARTDDGLYTCTGRSTGGETVGWGHITVQFAPTFEQQPTNEFWSWEQEKVNLTCLATSIPNATIQWYLRNKEIPQEDLNLRVLALGPVGVLQVNPLDNSYFGTYTCQATNTLGTVANDVTLQQVHKPGPISSAKVDQITATTVTWSLLEPGDDGGRPITLFVVQYKYQDAPWVEALTASWTKGSPYSLDGLMPQERYSFRFAAENEVGRSEWSGEKVEQMPEVTVPEEPHIYTTGEGVNYLPYTDHYDVQWKAPLDNGSPIQYYTVIYYQVKTENEEKFSVVGEKTTREVDAPGPTTYELSNLRPDTYYRIELRARNAIGFSSPAELVIKTAKDPNAPASGPPGGAPYTEPKLGVGVVVGIAVIAFLVLAVILDITCFFCRDCGLTAALVRRVASNDKDKEAMLEAGKNNSEKSDTNGSPKIDEKPPPSASAVTQDREREGEPTETTPMIQGRSALLPDIVKGSRYNVAQDPEQRGVLTKEVLRNGAHVKDRPKQPPPQEMVNAEFVYQNFREVNEQHAANSRLEHQPNAKTLALLAQNRSNRPRSMTSMQTSRNKDFFQSMFNVAEEEPSPARFETVKTNARLAQSQADLSSGKNNDRLRLTRPKGAPPHPPTTRNASRPPPPLRSDATKLSTSRLDVSCDAEINQPCLLSNNLSQSSRAANLTNADMRVTRVDKGGPSVRFADQQRRIANNILMTTFNPSPPNRDTSLGQADTSVRYAGQQSDSHNPTLLNRDLASPSSSDSYFEPNTFRMAPPKQVAYKIDPYRDVAQIPERAVSNSPQPYLYASREGVAQHNMNIAHQIAPYQDASKDPFENTHLPAHEVPSTDSHTYQVPNVDIQNLYKIHEKSQGLGTQVPPRKFSARPTDLNQVDLSSRHPRGSSNFARPSPHTNRQGQNVTPRHTARFSPSSGLAAKSLYNLNSFGSEYEPLKQPRGAMGHATAAPTLSGAHSLGDLLDTSSETKPHQRKPSAI